MTRACFEPASFFFSGSVMEGCGGFCSHRTCRCRFGRTPSLKTLASESPIRFMAACAAHRSPTSANKPVGQDSWALMTPGLGDSTAPTADECQSFLDNIVAQFGRRRAWNDRPGAVRANEVLEVVRSACGDDGLAKNGRPLNCFSPVQVTRIQGPPCSDSSPREARSHARSRSENAGSARDER
jgi:hypothetical protein